MAPNEDKLWRPFDPDEVRTLAYEKRKLEEAHQVKAGEVGNVVEQSQNLPAWNTFGVRSS
jgi:hypothetical protein